MNIQENILLPEIYVNGQNSRPTTPENKPITMPKNITYAPKRPQNDKKGDFNDITFRFPSLNNEKQ